MSTGGQSFVSSSFFRRLASLLDSGTPAVLLTVIGARGSVPGKIGAKMFVTDAGHEGTIGGGKVENAAIQEARALLGSDQPCTRVSYDLNRDLGMTCGGSVDILLERLSLPARLVVFGAGHVSEPLCAFAAATGFAVTVCDDREEWLSRDRFPTAARLVNGPPAEAVADARVDGDTFVASVSPGHAVDLDVLTALLRLDVTPRYLGVIGSRRKGILLKKKLLELGFPEERVDAVRIPIGLNIGASGPTEIAVSIVAELVQVRRDSGAETTW